MDRQSAPKGAREGLMSEEFYKSWNIKGIAESVIKEIKEGEEVLITCSMIICREHIGRSLAEDLMMPGLLWNW